MTTDRIKKGAVRDSHGHCDGRMCAKNGTRTKIQIIRHIALILWYLSAIIVGKIIGEIA